MVTKKYHLIFSMYFLAFGILVLINYESNFIHMEKNLNDLFYALTKSNNT